MRGLRRPARCNLVARGRQVVPHRSAVERYFNQIIGASKGLKGDPRAIPRDGRSLLGAGTGGYSTNGPSLEIGQPEVCFWKEYKLLSKQDPAARHPAELVRPIHHRAEVN